MNRVIYFKTTNDIKIKEANILFDRYGVKVVNVKPETKIYAEIEEHTSLVPKYGNVLKGLQLEPVINTSKLMYHVYFENQTDFGMFESKVEGFLDFTKKQPDSFGFDSIFTIKTINKTFFELKQCGKKVSARNACLSKFIEKFLYRKTPADWTFNPQKYKVTLELHRDPWNFFSANKYVNNNIATQYGFMRMVKHVLNLGLFFRASQNRRQNLYWFPGLNAGIPFVSKPKDLIHELVFFIHDMVHQTIPDLIYTGEVDKISRFIYIIYRLMSEAITLVSADMFFVNSLLRSGFEYKTINERKIYPLFESMHLDFDNQETFFDLLRANMIFCMLGDTTEFEKFQPDPNTLNDFKNKYEKFFIQDFDWTRHNFHDMKSHAQDFEKWWEGVKLWSPQYSTNSSPMVTITDFKQMFPDIEPLIENKQYKDACLVIFDKILTMYVKPAFTDENKLLPFEIRYDRMFRRYMMGQAHIFYQYPDDSIFQYINGRMRDPTPISIDEGTTIRNFYNEYLQDLLRLSLITSDDYHTYSEIYPLFEPMILSYDNAPKVDHKAFVLRILDEK